MFRDRRDAGRQLAQALEKYRTEAPVVLGLPRGGVPVAHEVAKALGAPLDIVVVRKVGAPGQEELGLGAVAEGGITVLHTDLIGEIGVPEEELLERVERKRAEVEERTRMFRQGRDPVDLRGRTVLVVDDGIATGGTVAAALRSVHARGGRRVVLAVPIASRQAMEELSPLVDEVVCLHSPSYLGAIGAWYEDFSQTSDQEVLELLAQPEPERSITGWEESDSPASPLLERELTIDAGGVPLPAHLAIPPAPRGLVMFAHGSGSSRHSPRNQQVAQWLQKQGLATLLFDLLTAREELEDEATGALRFDIPLLAQRLIAATDWLRAAGPLRGIPLLYFGASTGAAAALMAAAERPGSVKAIVSRGGRPDLARAALLRVTAPVLLLVGGADTEVLELNRQVLGLLPAGSRLAVVPGATHLFPEPGALHRVAVAAASWFLLHVEPTRAAPEVPAHG